MSAEKFDHNTRMIARLYGLVTFTIALMIFCSVKDTLHQEPPVIELNSSAHVVVADEHPELVITRYLRKNNDNTVRLRTELINPETKQSIYLAAGKISLDGSGYLQNTFVLPAAVTGKWCIDSDLVYSYGFSLTEHTHALKDVCIEIPVTGNITPFFKSFPKETKRTTYTALQVTDR
jgi:hypothetical protein